MENEYKSMNELIAENKKLKLKLQKVTEWYFNFDRFKSHTLEGILGEK